MPSSLDAFIKSAVAEVDAAKTKGKKGRDARKRARAVDAEIEEMKKKRAAQIAAAAEALWRPRAYVQYYLTTICPCCNAAHFHTCGVHFEERHARTGAKRSREIEGFIPPRDFAIPRIRRNWDTKFQLCEECFHRPGPEQLEPPARCCHQLETGKKKVYHAEELRWQMRIFRKIMPKYLLLTHDGENRNEI